MSAVDRLLTILLWAIAFGLSEAATAAKKKKKVKIPIGGIVGIIIIVVVIIIVVCLVLFLIRRRKAKANKAANISQAPLGAPSGGGEGYPMAPGSQGQGKYEPVQQHQPQEYQQQTNYGQPPPQPYGAPPQQQGYGQGPPASYPGGPPPAQGAANDYYKP